MFKKTIILLSKNNNLTKKEMSQVCQEASEKVQKVEILLDITDKDIQKDSFSSIPFVGLKRTQYNLKLQKRHNLGLVYSALVQDMMSVCDDNNKNDKN